MDAPKLCPLRTNYKGGNALCRGLNCSWWIKITVGKEVGGACAVAVIAVESGKEIAPSRIIH
jgi:hypothetical protein